MRRFLITLSFGPVQSLIGAARRTRDLWCGSWLLSEAARAAALVLHKRHPGCLIFPSFENPDTELLPHVVSEDAANVANVLRADIHLRDEAAVRELCECAKAAAISRIEELGATVLSQLNGQGLSVRQEVWDAQINDILEGFAAWVLTSQCDEYYACASKRLGRVLAARKATRNFQACQPLSMKGLPKSSLDGALETVLPKIWPNNDFARRMLRLTPGEQLDSLGVIKRLAGDSDQFTAIARVAADPWIERLSSANQKELCAAYEPLVELGYATRTSGNNRAYDVLPYDAMLLYPFRLENAISQATDEQENRRLSNLKSRISEIVTEAGRTSSDGGPVPFAAILQADGDRMGQFLSKVKTAEEARKVSRALHNFASTVRATVRNHRGHAIYAGGDDVLALLPLATARACSENLSQSFKHHLFALANEMGLPESEHPTLSAGLGIGHVMEPMATLRDRAKKAEKLAKDGTEGASRNAFAIIIGARSGFVHSLRIRWNDSKAFEALDQFIEAFQGRRISVRTAYKIRRIDNGLSWCNHDDKIARRMKKAEVIRILHLSRIGSEAKLIPEDLQELILDLLQERSLKELADTMLAARWLSSKSTADLGEIE